MTMQVTPLSISTQAIQEMGQETAQLAHLQQEAATGNSILSPSDNPIGTISVMAFQSQDNRLGTYLTNVQDAQTLLNSSVSNLQQASSILSQANQIAIEGSQTGNDASSNAALAAQMDGLINQMLAVANAQQGGRYLYGGAGWNTAPFVVTSTDSEGRPTSIAYQGSNEQVEESVGQSQTVGTIYAGNQVFQGQQSGPVITGTTGAAAGQGADTGTGQGTLTVQHTLTTYAAGSGVQAGSSSPTGDTIIGPAGAHTLTINDTSGTGASGTVALDGGSAVAFTSSDTNLKVTSADGSVVYIDTSNIQAGFNGKVAITANGTLSVDGGTTTVPINFSTNQAVQDGATGANTSIDSTNIRSVGTDNINYSDANDAFQVLMAIRDDLRNPQLSSPQLAQALSGQMSNLQQVQNGVLGVTGEQSASLVNLQTFQSTIQNSQLQAEQQISNLQGADISSVVIGLQEQQNLYQATMLSASQFLDQSLVDFLK